MKTKVWRFYVNVQKTGTSTSIGLPVIDLKRSLFGKSRNYYESYIQGCLVGAGYERFSIHSSRLRVSTHFIIPLVNVPLIITPQCEEGKKISIHPDTYKPEEYIPERGELKIGTQLEIDYKNPVNWPKSGMGAKMWVSDILHSEAKNTDLYELTIKTDDPFNVNTKPSVAGVLTADEIFSYLAIVKPEVGE